MNKCIICHEYTENLIENSLCDCKFYFHINCYLEWLQKVKQVSEIIEQNRPKTFYFFGNELESANSNVSRRSAQKKVEKSREK